MKTQARHHGLWGFLLVGLVVIWCTREAGPLEALTAWGVQLSSWGSCTLMGLYTVAPTLYFRGATPHVTGKLLCAAILGMVMFLMGTTIGGTVAYLVGRACVGVWRTSRVARVVDEEAYPESRWSMRRRQERTRAYEWRFSLVGDPWGVVCCSTLCISGTK